MSELRWIPSKIHLWDYNSQTAAALCGATAESDPNSGMVSTRFISSVSMPDAAMRDSYEKQIASANCYKCLRIWFDRNG